MRVDGVGVSVVYVVSFVCPGVVRVDGVAVRFTWFLLFVPLWLERMVWEYLWST